MVRSVINSGSFVQLSFFDQFSNAGGFFDQVDGPVLVDVAGVVTVINNRTFLINAWFTNPFIIAFNFNEVYSSINLCSCVGTRSKSIVERVYRIVFLTIDVEFQAAFFNFSLLSIEFDFFACSCVSTTSICIYIFCTFEVIYSINFSCFGRQWNISSIFFVQLFDFIISVCSATIPSVTVNTIPFAITVSPEIYFFEYSVEMIISQFDVRNSFFVISAFAPIIAVGQLIISVQRHPDNVTWFEVYCFIVVQVCCCFSNDVAIFICYKQSTIKLEIGWPISLVVGTAIVGDSKSVSAHAQYHSRSHSYGKYFFHSLSSS